MMQLPGSPPPERRIVRLLGSGGMGVVYEAWDTRLERRVALKVLHPHLTLDTAMRDRLLKEARLAARVEHEGVVRIYNIHEDDGGICLEMQFVEGIPLNRLLALHALSPAHGADLLQQSLEALIACHSRNVVHCDLKPGNLLVTPEGKLMLTDFGISRAAYADHDIDLPTASLSGPMWGTPQYSPPEAWEGASPTPSWDLYALGVLVHEALSGALPFKAHTPALLMREKLEGDCISIGDVRDDLSPQLCELIDGLQSTDTEKRPATAEVARALLQEAPEFRSDTRETLPFRHSEAVTVEGSLVPANFGLTTMHAGADFPMIAQRQSFAWKTHLAWIGVVVAVAALWYGFRPDVVPAPDSPGVAIVAPAEDVGMVKDLFSYRERAYFSYDDGQRGRELWIAEADGQARMIADINPGKASSNPRWFQLRPGGGLLFAATDLEHGEEPWYCESRPAFTTRILKDIIPGPMSSDPRPVAGWDDLFLFYASTLEEGGRLWVTNTKEPQTGRLIDGKPWSNWGAPDGKPVIFQDATGAYFFQEIPKKGLCLWRYSRADGKIALLGEVAGTIGEMAAMGRSLIFTMKTEAYGSELWIYEEELSAIHLLKDIWSGKDSSEPQQFFVWKDALYFQAETKAHGKELWKSDGTAAGTVEVVDILPEARGSSPYGFVAAGDWLFFRASNLALGNELWATDGVVGGTTRVYDLFPGPESGHPYNIVPIGKYLFFSAADGVYGEELWALSLADLEQAPFLVRDIRPGPTSSEPHSMVSLVNNIALFAYKNLAGEDALMRMDAGADGFPMTPYRGLRQIRKGSS